MPSPFSGAAWTGIREAQTAFAAMGMRADAAAKANVAAASAHLITEAMNNFRGAHKKGEPHYNAGKNPVTGQEYPNVVTGTLRRSIQAEGIRREGLGRYSDQVGPTARYGRAVELGRTPGAAGHPYFGPAVHNLRTALPAIASANWAKYLAS